MTLWDRIVTAWSVLWNGQVPVIDSDWVGKLNLVLGDRHTEAVARAYNKIKNEPNSTGRFRLYDEASGEVKRKEVLEWSRHFATKLGVKEIEEWRLNFALEYYVGKDKGFL